MKRCEEIIILGAGLSGLSAAHYLKKGFRLFERLNAPGGLCITTEQKGFRFDRTGHLLHFHNSKLRRDILQLLDDSPLEIERKSRIFSSGVYTKYPFQANTHGLPKEVVAECLVGFFGAQLRSKGAKKEETFLDFITQNFGDGIAKYFMIPYNNKLWGIHPKEITAAWCERFVPLPNIEEVVNGALGLQQKEMGYNKCFLYPKSGIQELPMALARRSSNIELATAPRAIDPKRRRIYIGGEWVSYRVLISTIPLDSLVKLLDGCPKRVIAMGSKLRCSSLRYLDVALSCDAQKAFHWIYVPEKKYPFYRVGCYSNFSGQMAPRGKSNLYVELSSRRPVNMTRLMPKLTSSLIEMGLIEKESQIEFTIPRLIPKAYVVYDKNREVVVPKLLNWLEEHSILCAGRYARWEYSSMEDSISDGYAAASQAKEYC